MCEKKILKNDRTSNFGLVMALKKDTSTPVRLVCDDILERDLRHVAQRDLPVVERVIRAVVCMFPIGTECRIYANPPDQGRYSICFFFSEYTGSIDTLACVPEMERHLGIHMSALQTLLLHDSRTIEAHVKMAAVEQQAQRVEETIVDEAMNESMTDDE